eukprot:CAMPEP_0194501120 /NCGR_PEP_ID=MMETSP0253-20130528/21377_1 /TAXON_ID=2966 /ORGANISM="Noctiluca scintillans" /LENGTH=100 /DNA_ID=CAMNT_0039343045 /DNA_START=139 /DNA_END=441 /DNA_ORIENTATION=-
MAAVKKDDLRVKLAQQYKASSDRIIVFGMKHSFGGGRSSGFALIYDSVEGRNKFEPKHRLVRIGHGKEKPSTRRAKKDTKNKCKKVRGKDKTKAKGAPKK